LAKLVETTASTVVPRLIGDDHLNNGKGITPVVVHGDLWSGNASRGVIGDEGDPQDVVYDPSACYAVGEYDLGIMRMFGGFGGSFLKEYHSLSPKSEPVGEYEDRVALYELYHHLNHLVRVESMANPGKLLTISFRLSLVVVIVQELLASCRN
jgi:protein-ribulosamine 3-kinase